MMRWLLRYREWLLLPLFIVMMLVAVQGCYWLTGRGPLDDPGELVALGYRSIRLAVVIAFSAFVQEHLFGFRAERAEGRVRLRDDVYDAWVSFGLLGLFSWLLWQ